MHRSDSGSERIANRRGSILYLTALGVTVFLGIAALAIDLGIWYVARSEAQRAAEAGAHAGASMFMTAPSNDVAARSEAESFSESNRVRGLTPDVLPDEDIDVIVDSQKVRVRVQRSATRGTPVSTIFARAMGIDAVDIGAGAAAQLWPADGVPCVLPLMIPDRWSEGPGLVWPQESDGFGDDPDDFYIPWDEASTGATGYDPIADWGTEIQIYAGDPSLAPQPSWWHPFAQPGGQGANVLREGILGCVDGFTDNTYFIGDVVDTEPGAQPGPIRQAFEELIDSEDLIWNHAANGGSGCPTAPSSTDCVTKSSRIRPIPFYDPRDPPALGRKPLEISNIAGVFVNDVTGNGSNTRVVVNFMYYSGGIPAGSWGNTGSFLKILRIVE